VKDVSAEQLKQVIETQHGGTATFLQSRRLLPSTKQPAAWDGVVHVFDLKDNPQATRAYAWSSAFHGGSEPRYFAVLHMGKVTGPEQAVKAAAAEIRKWGAHGTPK
jgi:hypothetical protein